MDKRFKQWIGENNIVEVECLVPDMNGVIRGKVYPAHKFLQSIDNQSLRLPSSVYSVTVTGEYTEEGTVDDFRDPDVSLRPDPSSLRIAPGFATPTAFVFADACYSGGGDYEIAPRFILKKVLGLFEKMGWTMVIAPELEFYLTQLNPDPDLPLLPPAGRSGRPETSPQPYGLEAVTEYEDLIEEIYEHAEAADLNVDTMIHESGTAQLEINFNHGDPVSLCDQVIVFKRIVRQVALKHDMHATFMAKPMEHQPGSAMHIHISAVDRTGKKNLFAGPRGKMTDGFRHFVGGMQALLSEVAPLFAPNVNSFRRMRPSHSAPINLQWGFDNRSCGLRVPITDAPNMRIENRLPGADANPYLALAATLVCGFIGVRDRIEPMAMADGNAYLHERSLPRNLEEALDRFAKCDRVIELIGKRFVDAFLAIKANELNAFQGVISSWERDHLLLKV